MMNKLNQIFAAVLISFSLNSFAGDCPAMFGSYTIGKSETADFASVSDAVSAVECGGVTGAVTFRIQSGTYNEQVSLSSIPGSSVMNTVTFESEAGSNTDVVIKTASSQPVIAINGASFVSFKNITLDHSDAINGNALRVDGNAANLNFKGVVFTGEEVTRTGTACAAVYFTATGAKTDICISDCEINNGSIGLYKGTANDSKTVIRHTLFFNQYQTALALTAEDAPVITNNVVSGLSDYNGFKGMCFDNISSSMLISNNVITIASNATGLALNNCNAPATHMGRIINNTIAVTGRTTACGISVSGTTDNQVINFNRIKLGDRNAANHAYYQNTGIGSNINLMNSIFYNLKTSTYTIVGNTYGDTFNQMASLANTSVESNGNGLTFESVTATR